MSRLLHGRMQWLAAVFMFHVLDCCFFNFVFLVLGGLRRFWESTKVESWLEQKRRGKGGHDIILSRAVRRESGSLLRAGISTDGDGEEEKQRGSASGKVEKDSCKETSASEFDASNKRQSEEGLVSHNKHPPIASVLPSSFLVPASPRGIVACIRKHRALASLHVYNIATTTTTISQSDHHQAG